MSIVTWKNGVSGSWQTGADWSGGLVPGVNDDALITNTGSYVVTSTSFVEVHSVQLSAHATLDISAGGFQLDAGTGAGANAGTIIIENSNYIRVAGTLDNTGTIELNSNGSTTQFIVNAPSVELTGGGSVVMSNSNANYVDGANAGFQLINVDNTISGGGTLGANSITLVNQKAGVIDANVTTALVVQTQNFVQNGGLMEATSGGILQIDSTNVNNVGGTLLASGGTVELTNSTIFGGTLKTAAKGVLETAGGNGGIDGITYGAATLAGTLIVTNATNLYLSGTLNDKGSTIDLSGTVNTTQIFLQYDVVTLTGGGSLVMSNSNNNYIQANTGFQDQLVNVDNTISGTGNLGNGNMTLINEAAGVIDATNGTISGSTGVLAINCNGGVTNAGLLEDTGTAGLAINSTNVYQTKTGLIEAIGKGSHVDLNSSNIVGGTLKTTTGGVIQTTSGTSQLDGLNSGAITNAGTFVINNNTDLNVAGTLNNTGVMNETSGGNTTEFRLNSWTVTLTGGGSINLSDNGNNYILSAFSGWQTLNNVNNTITGSGDIGNGGMQFINSGTVDATGSSAQLVINLGGASTGINNAGGLWEGSGSQGLVITNGLYTNNGTVEATNGSSVTYSSSAADLNLANGVLTGGTWKAVSTGSGTATVSITGGSVTADAASIVLSGAGSVLQAGNGSSFANIETTLTTIAAGGSLTLLNGNAYSSTLTLTDSGTITLGGATTSLGAAALTVAAGGLLTGNGSVTSNVTAPGSVNAAGGLLDFTKALSGPGSASIATGATLEVDGKLTLKGVSFASGGKNQVLALKAPASTTSAVSGFGKGTTIDLLNIGVTKLSYSGTTTSGTLTISSGTSTVAKLSFVGDYTTASFSFASDGHNGTDIVGTGSLAADLTSVAGYSAAEWNAAAAGQTPAALGGAGATLPHTPSALELAFAHALHG